MRVRTRAGLVAGVAVVVALAAAPGTASAGSLPVGTLTYLACIEDPGGPDDCRLTGAPLNEPVSIAASPDPTALYAGSFNANEGALVPLARNPVGVIFALPCIGEDGSTLCPRTTPGLIQEPDEIATSPDAAQIYAISAFDVSSGALAILRRQADGTLVDGGCFASFDDVCGVGSSRTVDGLKGPDDLAVSPDAESLYVVAQQGAGGSEDGTLVTFDRAPDGELTPLGCIAGAGSSACGAGNTTPGLAGASGVAVSPDGAHIYVTSHSPEGDLNTAGSTGAVLAFARGANGVPTPIGCIAETGSSVCGAGNTSPGLRGADDVAISADGATVYVASNNVGASPPLDGRDAAVAAFRRNADGTLSPIGCVAQAGSGECGGATMQGLRGARGLAASRDGHDLYVAAGGDFTGDVPGALAQLTRGADGTLTPAGCFTERGASICGSGRSVPGLRVPLDIAITPDDANVYVPALASDAIAIFARATAGSVPTGRCAGRAATIVGTSGNDTLRGTRRRDVIAGRGGNDTLRAKGRNDRVCGGAGKDRLKGGAGKDRLKGGRGKDRLAGGGGKDRLAGGGGKDRLAGGGGNDRLAGGAGRDRLAGGPGGNDRCNGGGGRDRELGSCER